MPALALPGVRTSERVRTRLHPTTTAGRHCTGVNAQGERARRGGFACMGSGGRRMGGEWAENGRWSSPFQVLQIATVTGKTLDLTGACACR